MMMMMMIKCNEKEYNKVFSTRHYINIYLKYTQVIQ